MTIAERPAEHELEPQVVEQLAMHRGRWVAMTRSRILAVGDSATEVVVEARRQGVRSPIVHRVPEDGHRTYFF